MEELIKLFNSFQTESLGYSLLLVLFIIASGAIGSFFGSYLKLKAENLATKKDIEIITLKVENIKNDLHKEIFKWEEEQEIIKAYRGYQHAIFEELPTVIVRIKEIFENKFRDHFLNEYDYAHISMDNIGALEHHKKFTTIYRIFRLLGALQNYKIQSSSLPFHKIHGVLNWYIDYKVTPVLTSGGFPGHSIIWRDSIRELSELMIEFSEKWKSYRIINIMSFVSVLKRNDSESNFLSDYCKNIDYFIKEPSIRLSLFGIYLIDIYQDILHNLNFEKIRDLLLSYIAKNISDFCIYGKSKDGRNDTILIDLINEVKPRNFKSKWYDEKINNCNYTLPNIIDKI